MIFLIARRAQKEVQIALDSIAPEAAPTEADALSYSFDFYLYTVNPKDAGRVNDLRPLHDMLVEDNLLLVDTMCAITDSKDTETINNVARSLVRPYSLFTSNINCICRLTCSKASVASCAGSREC